MRNPVDAGFVLVHGGFHRAACSDAVLPHLDAPAATVDLPGRGDRAAAGRATLEDFVTSVVATVDGAPFPRVVLVGHSLAGIVVPEVARRRPDRIAHLIFISATIPAEGRSVMGSVPLVVRPLPYWNARRKRATVPPRAACRWLFANDLDATATKQLLAQLSPESAAVGLERISRPAELAAVLNQTIRLMRPSQ